MDIIAISSLLVSGITAVGVVLHQIHLRNCSCFCVNSDCYKTPNNTPHTSSSHLIRDSLS